MDILESHRKRLWVVSTPKLYCDGTHRIRDPQETIDTVERFLPVMGITRIANVTGLDRIGIPVTVVCRPNSRSVATSQGKGTSLAAAKASGLMEAIETYLAEHIMLPLKHASFEEMRYTHALAEIDGLPAVKNSNFGHYSRILWIEGINLLNESSVWLPYELVHTDYTRPMPPGSGSFMASSNGLASGNDLSEAISHAICEVVERDAVTLWSLSSPQLREKHRVKLVTIEDPICCDLLHMFDAADIDVAVWEVTSDIGIPAMLVWIMERGNHERLLGRPSVGAGCHPTREIALSRALTEAAQERLNLIAGSRDDLDREYYSDMKFNEVFEITGGSDFSAGSTTLFGSCREDIDWQLRQLQRVGIRQVILVDLNSDLFRDIAVARVVVPGLEGVSDDPRYVPGSRARNLLGSMP